MEKWVARSAKGEDVAERQGDVSRLDRGKVLSVPNNWNFLGQMAKAWPCQTCSSVSEAKKLRVGSRGCPVWQNL